MSSNQPYDYPKFCEQQTNWRDCRRKANIAGEVGVCKWDEETSKCTCDLSTSWLCPQAGCRYCLPNSDSIQNNGFKINGMACHCKGNYAFNEDVSACSKKCKPNEWINKVAPQQCICNDLYRNPANPTGGDRNCRRVDPEDCEHPEWGLMKSGECVTSKRAKAAELYEEQQKALTVHRVAGVTQMGVEISVIAGIAVITIIVTTAIIVSIFVVRRAQAQEAQEKNVSRIK